MRRTARKGVVTLQDVEAYRASQKRQEGEAGQPANDNGGDPREPIDPRILRIAQAIGRHLAREHARARHPKPANDNKPG